MTLMKNLPRYLFIAAALLALAASLLILLTPTQVHSITNGVETTTRISLYEAQGWWGVVVLIIFADLYFAPLFFHLRGKLAWSLVTGIGALLLTVLAGFSIGPAYLPAAGALLMALILTGARRLTSA